MRSPSLDRETVVSIVKLSALVHDAEVVKNGNNVTILLLTRINENSDLFHKVLFLVLTTQPHTPRILHGSSEARSELA